MAQDHHTLSELTSAADVSARTVRYYIAEGLLPPPATAGPRSSYSKAHLNRLLLIVKLKRAYLPLREIRRRMDGMSDAEIEALLQQPFNPEHVPAAYRREELHENAASSISTAQRPSPIRHLRPRSPASSPTTGAQLHSPEHAASPGTTIEGVTWRRIELGPDAELLIREDAYDRKRDRVEWLINWARRVFN